MRKSALLFATLAMIVATKLQAQLIIQPQAATGTIISIDNLYAVMLINGTNSSISGSLEIKVSDANQGLVFISKSPVFKILPGTMLLPPSVVSVSSKNYGSNSIASSFSQTGQLPYGSYTICYSFYAPGEGAVKGMNCRQQQVQPKMPPFLVSPYNKEVINTTYPLLVWYPPTPIDPTLVTYAIKLTKLNRGQSYAQALRQNAPLLERSGISLPQLPYPPVAIPLQTKQDYVWQVAAFAGSQSLGITEIWSFRIGEQSALKEGEEEEQVEEEFFPRIDNFQCDGHYMTSGIIRFAFDNRSSDTALMYKVIIADTSLNESEVVTGSIEDSLSIDTMVVNTDPEIDITDSTDVIPNTPSLSIMYGLNELTMDLSDWTGWTEDQYYILQVTDNKRRTYTLTYQYRAQ